MKLFLISTICLIALVQFSHQDPIPRDPQGRLKPFGIRPRDPKDYPRNFGNFHPQKHVGSAAAGRDQEAQVLPQNYFPNDRPGRRWTIKPILARGPRDAIDQPANTDESQQQEPIGFGAEVDPALATETETIDDIAKDLQKRGFWKKINKVLTWKPLFYPRFPRNIIEEEVMIETDGQVTDAEILLFDEFLTRATKATDENKQFELAEENFLDQREKRGFGRKLRKAIKKVVPYIPLAGTVIGKRSISEESQRLPDLRLRGGDKPRTGAFGAVKGGEDKPIEPENDRPQIPRNSGKPRTGAFGAFKGPEIPAQISPDTEASRLPRGLEKPKTGVFGPIKGRKIGEKTGF